MKLILILLIFCSPILFSTSIYEIQYTTNPGGGTYPSPLEGQVVTTGGIVCAVDYSNGRFFISCSNGGIWNGLYIYDNDQNVAVGDSVVMQAEVYEYYGFTELTDLDYCNVISSGNPVPQPVLSTTNGIDSQEEYESVFSQVSNVVVTQTYDDYAEWQVSDGSGSSYIGTGFCSLQEMDFPLILGYPFDFIQGHVSYDWEEYKLNPRSLDDLQSAPEAFIISIADDYVFSYQEFTISIDLSFLGDQQQASSYQFELHYDPAVVQYTDYELSGTLSAGGTLQISQLAAGILSANFNGDFSFTGINGLLKLKFSGLENGNADLEFASFSLDEVNISYFSVGDIVLQLQSIPIGDTLTVIQTPLLNIPALTVPGDEIPIECSAPNSTSGWQAFLQHQEKTIPLVLNSSTYNNNLERWQLTAEIPVPQIYELYDLVVSAEGIAADTTWNAVKIIPEFKDDYYFVHITDTHLPTNIYYPDPLSLTDSTEVEDFREVIRDINLINPEFVLLTGDLVNEGEMEDFENRRVYSKAQNLLSELEVPVYLTTGNHDIGGWPQTPVPDGTARHNWQRFFGWNWLADPPAAEPYYTQNYSFDYGPVHFSGLESYINYDNFMLNLYGDTSFTAGQMQWLVDDLQQSSSSLSHVVFYHYDFADQINLVNLGIDMALYGHIHYNSGNITNPPYNISTKSTCDGNRAYRIIYVSDALLQPTSTVYAGTNGNNLQTSFIPGNDGIADSVYCSIQNYQPLDFTETQIKFIMPSGADEYTIYGGTLTQIDESGDFAVCYVELQLPANENIAVSAVAEFAVSASTEIIPTEINLTNYPNPFNPSTTISFNVTQTSSFATIEIYNLKGQKIKTFPNLQINKSSNQQIVWDGTDDKNQPVSSGIYFARMRLRPDSLGKIGKVEISRKLLLLK